MHFSQSSPALVLSYQTDLKVSQATELEAEVAEIWKDFQIEAERGKFHSAIIMANEVPTGRFIQQGHANNFVFQREAAGTWHRAAGKTPAAP